MTLFPRGAQARWLVLSLVFAIPYVIGTVAPSGANWGTHALGYLPAWVRYGGLALFLALLLPAVHPATSRMLNAAWKRGSSRGTSGAFWILAVAAMAFAVFYSFPIRTSLYGDTRTILMWDSDPTRRGPDWFAGLFDLHLMSGREVLTVTLHRAIAFLFSAPIAQVYRIVSALSGASMILVWLSLLRRDLPDSRWSPALAAASLVLGANQIYFGHIETYPFASFVWLAFLAAAWTSLERPAWYPLALILLVVAIKSHPVALAFVPAFVIVTLHALRSRWPGVGRLLTWRFLFATVIVPSLLLALALYFYYFRSFNEPIVGVGREFQHTFLPIVAAAPPLDRYTLQSLNHVRDLGNVLLLIGAPVLAVLAGVLAFHGRGVDWKHPRVMFAVLALGYPLMFFLTVNPALSMPRDWDLYALLGPPLLMATAGLLAHNRSEIPVGPVGGIVLAFGIFTAAGAAVNASPTRLSPRLEAVGEHVFRTYHAGAGFFIDTAQRMEPDTVLQLARREATLARLEPVGNDREYTHLIVNLESIYRARGDFAACVRWMERAAQMDPHDGGLALRLADGYLRVGEVERSKSLTDAILAENPRLFEALFLRAVAAAQERNYAEARSYLERAREVRPDLPDVKEWIEAVDQDARTQR